MRLLLATPLYPPEHGGPSTYAKLLFEGLTSRGIEVTVLKFSDVRHLPKGIRHFAYYRRLVTAAKHADVVMALDPVSVGLPAMKAAKKAGKPFVVKVVGDYAWEQGTQRFGVRSTLDAFVTEKKVPFAVGILRRIQTSVAQSATRIIVPSVYLKSIVQTWGVKEEAITVIYNGVALEKGGHLPASVKDLPRPRIVSVGRLVPWKNMEGVIDAVAKGKTGSLVIAGDGPLKEKLQRHAEEVLPETVFTGALSHEDTLALIEDADLFVLNSSYEGLSHLLIEALSLGTPTVATRAGGNTEVLEGSESGILVPVGDTEALSKALSQALNCEVDPAFAERFSSARTLDTTAKFLTSLV